MNDSIEHGASKIIQRIIWVERKRILKIVQGCRMTAPSPIGPLHGAGWNAAIDQVVKEIETLISINQGVSKCKSRSKTEE